MSGSIPLLVRWLTAMRVVPRAAVAQLERKNAPSAQSVLDAGRLAEKTYATLDALDDEVVLIARMGQNLSQFGLTYSHLGFAVRKLRRDDWGIVHLLNADDGRQSRIFEEGMVNFYSDNPYRFASVLLTLPAGVQRSLREMLARHGKGLHCPTYSLTSYPWSLATQNSNQWVIEVLAAALAGLEQPRRDAVQAWLREHGYRPSCLPIGLPTQWAGPLLRDSIRFDDQPDASRRQGLVYTVTVDSVLDWLRGEDSPFGEERRALKRIELSL